MHCRFSRKSLSLLNIPRGWIGRGALSVTSEGVNSYCKDHSPSHYFSQLRYSTKITLLHPRLLHSQNYLHTPYFHNGRLKKSKLLWSQFTGKVFFKRNFSSRLKWPDFFYLSIMQKNICKISKRFGNLMFQTGN